ncbi:hypothetical protein, partial [uncultured Aliiroseovarius sp.]|uniref:hypothetical protein n=1 Tax=uncultured Aliiroseovarius sp. TaxID=1658783 RepID=UPI00259832DF
AISAAGEGGSRTNQTESQPLFCKMSVFFQISDFFFVFGRLQKSMARKSATSAIKFVRYH